MQDKPLNPKRLQFCQEYVTSGHNGAEAYRVAYPGCKSGHRQNAQRLLTNDDIKQEISKAEAETRAEYAADRAGRQRFWADTMNKSTVPLPDRLRASELLGKSECDFVTVLRDETEKPTESTPEQMQRYSDMAAIALRDRIKISKEQA